MTELDAGRGITTAGTEALLRGLRPGAVVIISYDGNKYGTLYKHPSNQLYLLCTDEMIWQQDQGLRNVWYSLKKPQLEWQLVGSTFQLTQKPSLVRRNRPQTAPEISRQRSVQIIAKSYIVHGLQQFNQQFYCLDHVQALVVQVVLLNESK